MVVIVGILIALQINEWSEERRDRQLEKTYYCQFLEDVNQDQQLLENLIKENEGRIGTKSAVAKGQGRTRLSPPIRSE